MRLLRIVAPKVERVRARLADVTMEPDQNSTQRVDWLAADIHSREK